MRNVRIYYRKKGRMKFVSHLDMNRFMSRIITKSKIPVWYTEGFNQHIYMNYAIPLSLGFESDYEVMDIKIIDENFSNSDCLSALCAVCPADIEIFKVSEPILKMKDIGYAEFKLSFNQITDAMATSFKEFMGRESVVCTKKGKKGKIKEVDIIPKIKSYFIENSEITIILTAGNEENLNPSLVMQAFFEELGEECFYTVTRTAIFDKSGNLFE